jgi:hypothetical protein
MKAAVSRRSTRNGVEDEEEELPPGAYRDWTTMVAEETPSRRRTADTRMAILSLSQATLCVLPP